MIELLFFIVLKLISVKKVFNRIIDKNGDEFNLPGRERRRSSSAPAEANSPVSLPAKMVRWWSANQVSG